MNEEGDEIQIDERLLKGEGREEGREKAKKKKDKGEMGEKGKRGNECCENGKFC